MINQLPPEILSFICLLTNPTQTQYETYMNVCRWWRQSLIAWPFLKKMIYDGSKNSIITLERVESSLRTLVIRNVRDENFILISYNLYEIYADNCCRLSETLYNRILEDAPRLKKIEWNRQEIILEM